MGERLIQWTSLTNYVFETNLCHEINIAKTTRTTNL